MMRRFMNSLCCNLCMSRSGSRGQALPARFHEAQHRDEKCRHEENREYCGRDHAAGHASAYGILTSRARTRGDRQGQYSEEEGKGGHQNGAASSRLSRTSVVVGCVTSTYIGSSCVT